MERRKEKVTVGIICRNEERTIARTLESVLKNEWPNLEVVVVDGNSQDRTPRIVEEIAKRAKVKVRLIKEKPPYCHGNARNMVLDNTTGEYVAFIDAGGVCSSDWIRNLVEGLEKAREKDPAVVGGGGIKTIAEAETWKQRIIKAAFYDNPLGSGGGTGHHPPRKGQFFSVTNCNAIYLLDEIRKFRYLNIGFGEDYELNQRMTKAGKKLVYIPHAKVTYRIEDSFKEFLKKIYNYGKGQATVWKVGGKPRWYAWASFAGVMIGIPSLGMSIYFREGALFFGIILVYLTALAVLEQRSNKHKKRGRKTRSPLALILSPVIHISYGLGFSLGLVRK